MKARMPDNKPTCIDANRLDALFCSLIERGFTLIGPTIHNDAIIYDTITSTEDLPMGWTDVQSGGQYRLEQRQDNAYFGYTVGPTPWKRFLSPPKQTLFSTQYAHDSLHLNQQETPQPKLAFIGVRACDLQALMIHSKVFLGGQYIDAHYKAIWDQRMVIAVNCTQSAKTCFCVSMGTGPKATEYYDIALTEVIDHNQHYFLADSITTAGASILSFINAQPAHQEQILSAEARIEHTRSHMKKSLEPTTAKGILQSNPDHPRWDDVAERCLSCGNCTMVCPTCFCHSIEDQPSMTGDESQRIKIWDSCFSQNFTHLSNGNTRNSVKSRYRHWITHKLSTWYDQFGTSGCVGCGRCITWCPVGIDLTEEVAAIAEKPNEDKKRIPHEPD